MAADQAMAEGARELFAKIVADYKRASQASRNIELGQGKDDIQGTDGAAPAEISCCVCRSNVSNGAFTVSMACCGAYAHVGCLANCPPGYKCPACHETLNATQQQTCRSLVAAMPPSAGYKF